MLRYTLGRLLSAIPVLAVVSLVSFAIIALVPGDMASEMAGPSATAEELARLRAELGLDKPILERMVEWYGALLRGDLGQSVLLRRSVSEAILERLPVTLGLTFLALGFAIVLGVLAGMVAAVRANTWTDQGVMALALIGLSLPISGSASSSFGPSLSSSAGCRRAATSRSRRTRSGGCARWRCPPALSRSPRWACSHA